MLSSSNAIANYSQKFMPIRRMNYEASLLPLLEVIERFNVVNSKIAKTTPEILKKIQAHMILLLGSAQLAKANDRKNEIQNLLLSALAMKYQVLKSENKPHEFTQFKNYLADLYHHLLISIDKDHQLEAVDPEQSLVDMDGMLCKMSIDLDYVVLNALDRFDFEDLLADIKNNREKDKINKLFNALNLSEEVRKSLQTMHSDYLKNYWTFLAEFFACAVEIAKLISDYDYTTSPGDFLSGLFDELFNHFFKNPIEYYHQLTQSILDSASEQKNMLCQVSTHSYKVMYEHYCRNTQTLPLPFDSHPDRESFADIQKRAKMTLNIPIEDKHENNDLDKLLELDELISQLFDDTLSDHPEAKEMALDIRFASKLEAIRRQVKQIAKEHAKLGNALDFGKLLSNLTNQVLSILLQKKIFPHQILHHALKMKKKNQSMTSLAISLIYLITLQQYEPVARFNSLSIAPRRWPIPRRRCSAALSRTATWVLICPEFVC